MVILKLEKLKTTILILLVLVSIVLTTRIWLDISIEGIFIMPKDNVIKEEKKDVEFDSLAFIKPEKMIINNNGKHTLLFNDSEKGALYNRILEEGMAFLGNLFSSKESMSYDILPIENLNKIRQGSNVEIILPFSFDVDILASILGFDKTDWIDIKGVDSIIMSFDSNLHYILDKKEGSLYEFNPIDLKSNMKFLLDMINKFETYSYVFLNELDSEKFSDDVFIPAYSSSFKLPRVSVTSEIQDKDLKDIAASFLNIEAGSLRSIVEPNGTVIYSDGSEKGMKINKDGLIEYVSYTSGIILKKSILSINDLVDIATGFIEDHLGFPYDTYISSIEKTDNDGCIIKYNYRYEGLPIINDNLGLKDLVEIEIAEGKVKKYKRLIRHIKETGELKDIKNPLSIIDILYKRLHDKNMNLDEIKIMDAYLAYMEFDTEKDIFMLPVWVLDVITYEGNRGKYIMNAETGVILSEPY